MVTRKRASVEQRGLDGARLRSNPSLLDLDAEEAAYSLKRTRVTVDEQHFDLRTPDDLGMAEQQELRYLLLRSRELQAVDVDAPPDDDGIAELDEIEGRIIQLILIGAPDGFTIDSEYKRNRLIELFTSGLGDTLLPWFVKVQTATLAAAETKLRALPTVGQPSPDNATATNAGSPGSSTAMAAD